MNTKISSQPLPSVVWETPSADSSGSMPLGNGDIGLNVWVDRSGDLVFYIAKTDAWSDGGQLLKIGKVRCQFQTEKGEALLLGSDFRWSLDLQKGEIVAASQRGSVRIWVDANHPVIRVEVLGGGVSGRVLFESSRLEIKELAELEMAYQKFCYGSPKHYSLQEVHSVEGGLVWFSRNETSCWKSNLETQGLAEFAAGAEDPLLGLTSGALIASKELFAGGRGELKTRAAHSKINLEVVVLTEKSVSGADFIEKLKKLSKSVPSNGDSEAYRAHQTWWSDFWKRSWIVAEGAQSAEQVMNGYVYQRYLNACAGRGKSPIKFNGSLFTADWNIPGEPFDANYRRWGGAYWHQNTRLPYWGMLASGDFDLIKPLFEMYLKALPLSTYRCEKHCGHPGAFFLETMNFWGTYLDQNYSEQGSTPGRDEGLSAHLSQNRYIRYHNSSSLEIIFFGIQYFKYTNETEFVGRFILPMAEAVLNYYSHHFSRKNGKLHIHPAQVIEQWWEGVVNPMPETAGLHAVLNGLLQLPKNLISETQINTWKRFKAELPELPTRMVNNKKIFSPAHEWENKPTNMENPELYAIFPYFLHQEETSLKEIALNTFRARTYRDDRGWAQDGIQAALLGEATDAFNSVIQRFCCPSPYARFAGFFGPNYDWVPDQDHGSCAVMTLQQMALQRSGKENLTFQLWPQNWTGDIKLCAENQKVVTARKDL